MRRIREKNQKKKKKPKSFFKANSISIIYLFIFWMNEWNLLVSRVFIYVFYTYTVTPIIYPYTKITKQNRTQKKK